MLADATPIDDVPARPALEADGLVPAVDIPILHVRPTRGAVHALEAPTRAVRLRGIEEVIAFVLEARPLLDATVVLRLRAEVVLDTPPARGGPVASQYRVERAAVDAFSPHPDLRTHTGAEVLMPIRLT